MEVLFYILLYLSGSVLYFGRIVGITYSIEEKFINCIPCDYVSVLDFAKKEPTIVFLCLFSWLSFLCSIFCYGGDKYYFLKYSFNNLNNK